MVSNLPTERLSWTIHDLVVLHEKGNLLVNLEYQRSEVWKRPKEQLLIDSILRDYDIGCIILKQKKDDKWEIIDGQQRVNAINRFVENKFSLGQDVAGAYAGDKWEDLTDSIKWANFMSRHVYTTKMYSIDDETTSTIFLRVQEGMPLNTAEKLNALRGDFRNEVYEAAQHPFFEQTGIKAYRFAYRYLIAQFALQEINQGLLNHVFRNAKGTDLYTTYLIYRNGLPSGVFPRIKTTLNFLKKALHGSASLIKDKSDLITIYLLASYVLQKYAMNGKDDVFKDFVVDFLTKVEGLEGESDNEYYRYWVARSHSPDSKGQIENRFKILLQKFLEYIPTLELKDPQRVFDWGQKLAIYSTAYTTARLKGKKEAVCAECGKVTAFIKGEPDHIKAHTSGGKTIVKNGRWTCITCNRSLGGKKK